MLRVPLPCGLTLFYNGSMLMVGDYKLTRAGSGRYRMTYEQLSGSAYTFGFAVNLERAWSVLEEHIGRPLGPPPNLLLLQAQRRAEGKEELT